MGNDLTDMHIHGGRGSRGSECGTVAHLRLGGRLGPQVQKERFCFKTIKHGTQVLYFDIAKK